jgi:monofunctional biosynthetic peptidoglycan transglycosylase
MEPWNVIKLLATENPKETAYMLSWRKEQQEKGISDSITHKFIPLDSISKHLVDAVLAAEDDGFWIHPGFDLIAMLNAYQDNLTAGKLKRGGSTITQQLAKNMFLSNEKSFDRKFRELAYTVLIEKEWGKKRILELYMNYAEWGKGIFGCEAAAIANFNKSASTLTREQSVRLAAVLVSPNRLSANAPNSRFMSSRIQVIANNLLIHGKIDDTGYIMLTGKRKTDSLAPDTTSIETENNNQNTDNYIDP